ncbi:tumor necrosis factor alpha-induced protein 2-like isoform X1 [Arapaima gigas]
MDELAESYSNGLNVEDRKCCKSRFKLPMFKRQRKNPSNLQTSPSDCPPATEVNSFEENLRQFNLSKAGQQLIEQEECLFKSGLEVDAEIEQERDRLQRCYESLLFQVWLSVQGSLSAGDKELVILKKAVQTIQQEEKQDERWNKAPEMEVPVWRPRQCWKTHDFLLQNMVTKQMSEPDEVVVPEVLSSTLKKDIYKMGKQLYKDLLKVVQKVKECYPTEFDVCNLYARLYHQAFSQHLMKIAESSLEMDELKYLLYWVYDEYPNGVLGHEQLKANIECGTLGALLPEEMLRLLEEQYLTQQEKTVETWISTALQKEHKKWKKGELPACDDGYYMTDVAIDVIQIVDGAVKETSHILGDTTKVQRIGCQLEKFLESYERSLVVYLKLKHDNIGPVTKAILTSTEQCRDHILRCTNLYTEEMRTRCLAIINNMEECCQKYLLKAIHQELKPYYRNLGTLVWLTEVDYIEVLLQKIEDHIETNRDLKLTCLEALLGRLHQEVVVEYVRRLMKKKLKLKDEEQQEKLVKQLCEDNEKLHCWFTKVGSKEEWLSSVLQGISEIMKLQDPESIKLEVASLALVFPDLSQQHVSALLYLKPNLNSSHIKNIRQSMVTAQSPNGLSTAKPFFSRVKVK